MWGARMVRAADLAASLGDPSDTISSKINMISERAVLWNDSSTVKEAVERLREGSNLVEILEEVKEQLHVNPPSHNDFLTAGGAQVRKSGREWGGGVVEVGLPYPQR